jgi:hypothetical protein
MGVKPKYTRQCVLDKCKTLQSRFEFAACGLKRVAIRLNMVSECLLIIDKNNINKKLIEQTQYITHVESCISKCKTITEFRQKYPQFRWFVNKNLKHYKHKFIKQKFSTQQLVCKKLLETILSDSCLYNCRTILNNRKEIDIYFEKFKLACEYDSYFWHNNKRSFKEDTLKKLQCNTLGICLINIKEPSLNFYKTFEQSVQDIKEQIKKNLFIINKAANKLITPDDVDSVNIDYIDLLKDCYNLNDIEYIINNCNSYAEVRLKYNKIWQYLQKNKLLSVLDPVKRRDHRHMSKDEYIKYITKECFTYTQFLHHKSYKFAYRRGYTPEIKQLLSISNSFRSFP